MKKSWSFTTDIFIPVEYRGVDDIVLGGCPIPLGLLSLVREHFSPQDIETRAWVDCRGSYTPAHTYGDPYDCYPAEQEEERNIKVIFLPDGIGIGDATTPDRMDLEQFLFREFSALIQDYVDAYDVDYPEDN